MKINICLLLLILDINMILGLTNVTDTTNTTNTIDITEGPSETEIVIEWIKTLNLIESLVLIIATFIFVFFMFYSCCIFGKKKPPLKYEYIVRAK